MSDIAAALARYPRESLTRYPTPIQPLPALGDRLGLDIWLKRDDLTDLALGGDKPRKLEYELAAARAAGVPVIYTTRHVNTGPVRSTHRDASPAEDSYDIIDELAPEKGELVIYKERASAFFGTPLVAHLNRMGISSIIALGESTSGCVRASVVDGYSNGYHMTVVEECVFDRSELSHKVNLFDMHHKYADVMKLDEVTAHLERVTTERKREKVA